MKTNLKAIALSIVMAGTLAITSILPVSIENTVQAKSNKIQYNNSIFTDKLYKETAMTKKGKKLTYFFQNGEVHTESKEYIIVDNDPLDGIRKIYKSMKR